VTKSADVHGRQVIQYASTQPTGLCESGRSGCYEATSATSSAMRTSPNVVN
jgi:hypothetical protein